MTKLPTLTYQQIVGMGPCAAHHPDKYIPKTWEGTVIDLMDLPNVAATEKLWVLWRVLDERLLRFFAADCADRALTYPANYTPDPRTLEAIRVVKLYAAGNASRDELNRVCDAATAANAAANAAAANAAANAAAANAAAANAADAAAAAAYAVASAAAYAAAAAAAAAHVVARQQERNLQLQRLRAATLVFYKEWV
jgi:hypothetical protein